MEFRADSYLYGKSFEQNLLHEIFQKVPTTPTQIYSPVMEN